MSSGTHLSGAEAWVLTVDVTVRPGCEQRYLDAVGPVLDEMRHEKGFIYASLSRSESRSNRFQLHEVWASREDFVTEQVARAYRRPYMEVVEQVLLEPFKYREWRELRADYALHTAR